MEVFNWIILFVLVVGTWAFYFLPYLYAVKVKHKDRAAIGLVNLVAGWTILGWALCVFWAFAGERKEEEGKRGSADSVTDLEHLFQLRKNGLITAEAYNQRRRQLSGE